MTRRRAVLVATVAVASFLALSPTHRAGACTDGRDAPWCTTTTSSTTSTSARPPATTTASTSTSTSTTVPRVGTYLAILNPPTTTVQVIDLPPIVASVVVAAAPVEILPRFAG